VYAPGLRTVLRTVPPSAGDWLVVLGCSLLPLAAGQAVGRWRRPAGGPAPS
jgi:hypothetical protein